MLRQQTNEMQTQQQGVELQLEQAGPVVEGLVEGEARDCFASHEAKSALKERSVRCVEQLAGPEFGVFPQTREIRPVQWIRPIRLSAPIPRKRSPV